MAPDALLPADSAALDRIEQLYEIYPKPAELAVSKQLDYLDPHLKHFIGLSPFLCLSTADADGRADVSPRGDHPGFVIVLDDRTLVIPDRPGNNRLDSLQNVIVNPEVGLLFFVPGVDETARINGRARIVTDGALLDRLAIGDKRPRSAMVVAVREAYLHCAKALRRSKMWDPAAQVPDGTVPSLARMIADQTNRQADLAAMETRIAEGYKRDVF